MPSLAQRHHTRILGTGPETLVFAHGFGSDQSAWRHQVAALATRYRIVLFDHMGAGRSDPTAYDPRRYRSLWTYADDVNALFVELELEDVTFVGHSMGGMIGALAYLSAPQRFRRLVLIGASPRYLNDDGYEGGFSRADLDALYGHMIGNYEGWVRGFAGVAMGHPDKPELAAEFAQTLGKLRPDRALSTAQLIFEADHRSILRHCDLPALVLQTRHDVAVPVSVGEGIAAMMPHATYELVDTTGHFPHLSAPELVTCALERFFAATPLPKATIPKTSVARPRMLEEAGAKATGTDGT